MACQKVCKQGRNDIIVKQRRSDSLELCYLLRPFNYIPSPLHLRNHYSRECERAREFLGHGAFLRCCVVLVPHTKSLPHGLQSVLLTAY